MIHFVFAILIKTNHLTHMSKVTAQQIVDKGWSLTRSYTNTLRTVKESYRVRRYSAQLGQWVDGAMVHHKVAKQALRMGATLAQD